MDFSRNTIVNIVYPQSFYFFTRSQKSLWLKHQSCYEKKEATHPILQILLIIQFIKKEAKNLTTMRKINS